MSSSTAIAEQALPVRPRPRGVPHPADFVAAAAFGYHEVFHALTLVALACRSAAIAFFVVRVG